MRILFLLFLLFTAPFAAAHPPEPAKAPINLEKLLMQPGANGAQTVRFQLADARGNPVTLASLDTVHEKKMHLMLIDSSLQDYQHLHPVALQEAGWYGFSWTAHQSKNSYRFWLDTTASANHQQVIISRVLQEGTKAKLAPPRSESHESRVDGFRFKLAFDNPVLETGQMYEGKIRITRDNGTPVTDLQPIMGAFAHLAGFQENFRDMVHLHPGGKEPTSRDDRGGPELVFHFMPEKPGLTRLFVQVKIHGQEHIGTFTLQVQPRKALA